ncbi:hypothetical protein ACJIZ3_014076 [Penstemon smallii]|uniref:F-box domain-containing protein n=1 Tax=Penstemon smallii TaxID=265156 RepID=A0ABD3RIJ2_9LAMI
MADWSKLPFDLLVLIVRRINFIDDFKRFRMVCQSWRSIYSLKKNNRSCSLLPSLLPLLMLMEEVTRLHDIRKFFSPFNNKTYRINLPELHYGRCWGSSNGWLVTLSLSYKLHLVDPLTHVRILLPSLSEYISLKISNCADLYLSDINVDKVVISSGSSLGDSVVLAICNGNNVAFAKPGGESWTPLQCGHVAVHDAIYFGGKFFVASYLGDVIICDSNGSHLKTVASHLKTEALTYIAEVGGQIYMIRRFTFSTEDADNLDAVTLGFNVYKLDKCNDKFEEVETLGNWSIFVGSNYSFSISGTDYPSYKSNLIFFSDNYFPTSGSPYDVGFYSLDDDHVCPLFEKNLLCSKKYLPVWIKLSW